MTSRNADVFVRDEELEEFVLEQEQKLKSAIWLHMEFLSLALRIDEPSVVIDETIDLIEEYYYDFPTIDEYFERKKYSPIKGEIEEGIEEFNLKLMYAVREQMEFIRDVLETDESTVIIMMSILAYKAILEYSPREGAIN